MDVIGWNNNNNCCNSFAIKAPVIFIGPQKDVQKAAPLITAADYNL